MYNPQGTLNVMDADMDSLVNRILTVDDMLDYWAKRPIEKDESEEFYALRNTMELCVTALNKVINDEARAISRNISNLKKELKSNDPWRDPAAGGVADNLVHLVPDEHEGEVSGDGNEER